MSQVADLSSHQWAGLFDLLNNFVFPLLLISLKIQRDGTKEMQQVRERLVAVETTLNIKPKEQHNV